MESPLGDFFCCGFGVSYSVNSMPIAVNPTRGFNCYFPMPFGKKAKITIENQNDEEIPAFFYQVDYFFMMNFRRIQVISMHSGEGSDLPKKERIM